MGKLENVGTLGPGVPYIIIEQMQTLSLHVLWLLFAVILGSYHVKIVWRLSSSSSRDNIF